MLKHRKEIGVNTETQNNQRSAENIKSQFKANVLAELFIALIVVGIFALIFLVITPHLDGTLGIIIGAILIIVGIFAVLMLFIGLKSAIKEDVPAELKLAKGISIFFQVFIIILCFASSVSMYFLNDYIYSVGYRSGNHSEYTCADCEKPADGGYWKASNKADNIYYCEKHFAFHKQLLEEYRESQSDTDKFGHDWAIALTIAEDVVEQKLKSPATANFSSKNETDISVRGNSWTVTGWVDAQNSFGATIRTEYSVKITFTSKDRYTIDYCNVG